MESISSWELKNFLQSKKTILLIDVRSPREFEITRLPNSINVPLEMLSEYCAQNNFPDTVIAICHHGVRSIQACAILKRFGIKNAMSLRGGLHDYANAVDSSIQCY